MAGRLSESVWNQRSFGQYFYFVSKRFHFYVYNKEKNEVNWRDTPRWPSS